MLTPKLEQVLAFHKSLPSCSTYSSAEYAVARLCLSVLSTFRFRLRTFRCSVVPPYRCILPITVCCFMVHLGYRITVKVLAVLHSQVFKAK